MQHVKWGQIATTFDFKRQQPMLRQHTRQVARCLETASDAQEGQECLSKYFSVLPHDVLTEALRKGEEDAKDTRVASDAKTLAETLRGCIDVSAAWAGVAFCLQDLVANIPHTLAQAAVKTARAYPSFDYSAARHQAKHEAAALSWCVHLAVDVQAGTACLAAFLGALPHALSARSVRLSSHVPPVYGRGVSPQTRAQELVRCLTFAKDSDSAVYCLSDYLRTLPSLQVSQVPLPSLLSPCNIHPMHNLPSSCHHATSSSSCHHALFLPSCHHATSTPCTTLRLPFSSYVVHPTSTKHQTCEG